VPSRSKRVRSFAGPDYIDGRPRTLLGQPDAHHVYAPAPGLAAVLTAQSVTLEALSELTGYPVDYLRRMRDEEQIAPRVVTSKISPVLSRGRLRHVVLHLRHFPDLVTAGN
jgi:hypothetical protein